jgi:hypothetical protein
VGALRTARRKSDAVQELRQAGIGPATDGRDAWSGQWLRGPLTRPPIDRRRKLIDE